MVVLAASLVTKSGKALVSRQFVEMSRIRIEGLLAAFPKLVGIGKQHTYVETENVRYVYQPMEGIYLVLVTNKSSNILEDLETLRLLSKTIPEYIHSMDEDSVTRGAFELIFAFDEVISMGHKENITVQQIRQNTDMESHEEKLHKMIIQSKINDTKDVMKRKAMEIDKHKLEQRARDVKSGFSSIPKTIPGIGGGSSMGGSMDMDIGPNLLRPDPVPSSRPPARPMGGKGMQLGKGKKTNTLIDSLKAEGEVIEADPMPMATSKHAAAAPPPTDPITITVEEKLVVLLNKDGGLENMEIQGTMSLQVLTEDDAFLRVALDTGNLDGFQFKTHPNIDKQLYANEQVLGLRDPERPFPTGSALGILKWRLNTTDEAMVPLLINCWPSVSGGESYVNIEYESQAAFDLQRVEIAIPLPAMSHAPQVNQVDGQWRYEPRRSALLWTIDIIDKTNATGSMEFVVPACDPATFFPVEVEFTATKTFCDVRVGSVTNLQNNAPAKYAGRTLLATEEYQIA